MGKPKKKPSLYDLLGVAKDASEEDLKQAFRAAAKETHPDTGGSASQFEAVKTAHLVLSDKKRRAHYDETGDVDEPDRTTVDQIAIGILANLLNAVLGEEPDPLVAPNLIEMMVKFMEGQLEKAEQNLTALKRAKARAEKMRKRFKKKKKGDDDNLMERLVASKIVELERLLPQNEKNVLCNKRAIEMLGEYSFDADIGLVVPTVQDGVVYFR